MPLTPLLALAAAGFAAGLLGAVLGIGGGAFLIPVLVLGFNVPMHHAVAASLVAVIATSSAVASTNVERGTANMRLGMTLELTTVLGALSGAVTSPYLSARTLEAIFAIVLVPVAILLWRGRKESVVDAKGAGPGTDETGLLGGRYRDEAEGRVVVYRVRRLWAGLGISLAAGNLSGLLGIGGGAFKVPALHLLCGVPMKAAAATSNFMIGVTAAASAFLYFGQGKVEPSLTAAAVLGVLGGSSVGSVVNRYVRGALVRRLFAGLLVIVAAQMIYRAWTGGQP